MCESPGFPVEIYKKYAFFSVRESPCGGGAGAGWCYDCVGAFPIRTQYFNIPKTLPPIFPPLSHTFFLFFFETLACPCPWCDQQIPRTAPHRTFLRRSHVLWREAPFVFCFLTSLPSQITPYKKKQYTPYTSYIYLKYIYITPYSTYVVFFFFYVGAGKSMPTAAEIPTLECYTSTCP